MEAEPRSKNLRFLDEPLVVQRVGALRHQPLGLAEHRLGVPGCGRGRRRTRRSSRRHRRRRRHPPVPPPRGHVRPGNSVAAAAAERGELGRQQQKHREQHGRRPRARAVPLHALARGCGGRPGRKEGGEGRSSWPRTRRRSALSLQCPQHATAVSRCVSEASVSGSSRCRRAGAK